MSAATSRIRRLCSRRRHNDCVQRAASVTRSAALVSLMQLFVLGVPSSCQCRPHRRAAPRLLGRHPAARLKISAPWLPGGRPRTLAPAGSPGQSLSVPGSTTSRRCPLSGPAASASPGPESQRPQQRAPAGASDGPDHRPHGPRFLAGTRV
ncbi:hypothetical protein NDU88_003917 [Pleurodeles waltl]|uniref:Uncharacterized protein n=1 Tax=Pleurodeles waltl TaxID=8319 RepID=A0AAV7QB30_PLEWA|nr:hypothetical protein NDU88_003917 [Pleurodeles waltl]